MFVQATDSVVLTFFFFAVLLICLVNSACQFIRLAFEKACRTIANAQGGCPDAASVELFCEALTRRVTDSFHAFASPGKSIHPAGGALPG